MENDEERVAPSKGDNIEIMMDDKTDETIEELFDLLILKVDSYLKMDIKIIWNQ